MVASRARPSATLPDALAARLTRGRFPARKATIELQHGSLLLMAGDTQTEWKHALPRTAKPVPARINLTFRRILPSP